MIGANERHTSGINQRWEKALLWSAEKAVWTRAMELRTVKLI